MDNCHDFCENLLALAKQDLKEFPFQITWDVLPSSHFVINIVIDRRLEYAKTK